MDSPSIKIKNTFAAGVKKRSGFVSVPDNRTWQVSSLALSKKLKTLGVKQESLWAWMEQDGSASIEFDDGCIDDLEGTEVYSAYTVAELGLMLPCEILFEKYLCKGKVRFCNAESNSITNMAIHDDNEANCRAKILIYLLENKLMPEPRC